jgi:flagellar hook assembly protein FlgD
VGVRPGRTEITESWNGTDEKLSIVPDGNYIFKIVASTDLSAIDTVTGDVRPGSMMAEDLIVAELPVVRGGSVDPQGDFVKNSFLYPNPLRDATGTFQIYVPLQAKVTLKLYNIAGELVLEKDFGEKPADSYVTFNWAKTNQAGRAVAHGVYFAVIREEPSKGEKTALQTVKKFLIP